MNVTRRAVMRASVIYGIVVGACSRSKAGTEQRLGDLAKSQHLAIVAGGLKGFTVSGRALGMIEVPDCCVPWAAVSPDARWIGWMPTNLSSRRTRENSVYLRSGSSSVTVDVPVGYVTNLANLRTARSSSSPPSWPRTRWSVLWPSTGSQVACQIFPASCK
jgi:hypothetical protein